MKKIMLDALTGIVIVTMGGVVMIILMALVARIV
jgi:hypothetical protein